MEGCGPAAVKCCSAGDLVVQVVMGEPSSLEAAWDEDEERELMVGHVFLFFLSPSAPSQKINRRLHLSKVKHSKFNESGQLVAFHLTSVIWCLYVVVTVRHGAGRDLGSQGETVASGAQNPTGSRVPSQPLGQTRHISVSLAFSCDGSLQPLSEGSFGRCFSCIVQGTGTWAVNYFWSWAPEILSGPIISILCSRTCCLSQLLIFLLIYIQCLEVLGFLLQGRGANGQNFGITPCASFLGKLMVRESLKTGKPRCSLGMCQPKEFRGKTVILGKKGEGKTGGVGEI